MREAELSQITVGGGMLARKQPLGGGRQGQDEEGGGRLHKKVVGGGMLYKKTYFLSFDQEIL